VTLAKVKDDLSKYLRFAAAEEIVITRHGRPAGILMGFATEEDWFDYLVKHHPAFLRRIEEAPPFEPATESHYETLSNGGLTSTGPVEARCRLPRWLLASCPAHSA
jgi:prevent-host-death family protein